MKTYLTILLSACLVACGGGGGGGGGGDPKDSNPVVIAVTVNDTSNGQPISISHTVVKGEPIQFNLAGVSQWIEYDSATGCSTSFVEIVEGVNHKLKSGPIISACTINVAYRSTLPETVVVITTQNGYGGKLGATRISVPIGESISIPVELFEGFKIIAAGCEGAIEGNSYVIDAVSAACEINATFSPISQNTVQVLTTSTIGGSILPEVAVIPKGARGYFNVDVGVGFQPIFNGCPGEFDGQVFATSPINSSCTIDATFIPIDTSNVIVSSVVEGGEALIRMSSFRNNRSIGSFAANLSDISGSNTITAILYPEYGYEFDSISGCGGSTFEKEPEIYIDNAVSDCLITGRVKESTFLGVNPISGKVSPADSGQISPEVVGAHYGTMAQFNVTPNTGYRFLGISADTCNDLGTTVGDVYISHAVRYPCEFTAHFEPIQ